jgi:hypothetical protein
VTEQRAALTKELSEFLVEFSIALHKHAMYPDGHPSLAPAAAGVVRRAAALMQGRSTLSLGVARDQLVIEGVATDPKHPVLAELAGRLHRHHLGAVTVTTGVEPTEVADMLRTVAVEADRTGQPLGLGDPARLRAWPHLRLHPLTYERLELLDDQGVPPPADGEEGDDAAGGASGRRVRAAQLWIGLARAALAGQVAEEDTPPSKPAVIAQAIDRHTKGMAGGEAYDQVIVGYLLQIAEELKAAGGAEALELKRRTSQLIGALQPETLRRLVEMGGDFTQRRKFVYDAADGMAVDAVLEIVKAAADTSHQAISHSLVRMLSKLAAHAEKGTATARPLADTALRQQVQRLLSGWHLDDPNPGAYGAVLQTMSRAAPLFAVAPESRHLAEPERLLQMSIEVDTVGPIVWEALADLLEQGRLATVLDLVDAADAANRAAEAIRERAITLPALQAVLESTTVDLALVDRLVPRLGAAAAEPLLNALAAAEARATRRHLLERLVRMGSDVAEPLVARLRGGEDRWYVLRNLLGVLHELPAVPAGFTPMPFAAHTDVRVRREALRLQFKLPAERDQALVAALKESDPVIVRVALAAADRGVPPAAAAVIVARLESRSFPTELRAPAVRLLGRTRTEPALEALVRLTDGGKTLLGRPKLPPKSPELLAALAALATGWATDSRATAVLARAAVSDDAEIRAATDPDSGGGA